MDREKEIARMAVMGCSRNPLAHTMQECMNCPFNTIGFHECDAHKLARALYDDNYRKKDGLDIVSRCKGLIDSLCTVTVYTIFTRVLSLYQSLTKTEKEAFGFENRLLDLAQEFGLDLEKETITKPKE